MGSFNFEYNLPPSIYSEHFCEWKSSSLLHTMRWFVLRKLFCRECKFFNSMRAVAFRLHERYEVAKLKKNVYHNIHGSSPRWFWRPSILASEDLSSIPGVCSFCSVAFKYYGPWGIIWECAKKFLPYCCTLFKNLRTIRLTPLLVVHIRSMRTMLERYSAAPIHSLLCYLSHSIYIVTLAAAAVQ